MTEAEWLTTEDSDAMATHLCEYASARKLRLWGCACCSRIMNPLPSPGLQNLTLLAENEADGHGDRKQMQLLADSLQSHDNPDSPGSLYDTGVRCTTFHVKEHPALLKVGLFNLTAAVASYEVPDAAWDVEWSVPSNLRWRAAWLRERKEQVKVAYDIFGNPFRPVTFSPEWRTGTVIGLAQTIYEERHFGNLPILADALQDAGCENAEVLDHCRELGPHVRGCWVIDLVLGKD